jgi:hypothetical protein
MSVRARFHDLSIQVLNNLLYSFDTKFGYLGKEFVVSLPDPIWSPLIIIPGSLTLIIELPRRHYLLVYQIKFSIIYFN